MKIQLVAFSVLISMLAPSAWAIQTTNLGSSWGYSQRDAEMGSTGDFMIVGAPGRNGAGTVTMGHGGNSHRDEYGIVSVIAKQITAHGGYFCPVQLQCAGKCNSSHKTWTEYYNPSGVSGDEKCKWLCEDGYSGVGCTKSDGPAMCDKAVLSTDSGGLFSGVGARKSESKSIESTITGFDTWNRKNNKECDVVLGVIKFLEHGVVVAPIQVCCNHHGFTFPDTYIDDIYVVGESKTLCAEGYKLTAGGANCEPIAKSVCDSNFTKMCSGWDLAQYDENVHRLDTTKEGCVKYFCSEAGYAFASTTDTSCVACAPGVKGGSNPENGTCVKCDTGKYFDEADGKCKNADAYTKFDMQYGQNQTKNTATKLEDQCWTKAVPSEYDDCVRGITSTNN